MKNTLYKNQVLNNNKANIIAIKALNEPLLVIDQQACKTVDGNLISDVREIVNTEIVVDQSNPNRLISLCCNNIKFNMIACPKGGKVKLEYIQGEYDPPITVKWKEYIDKPFMLGETEVTQELFESIMGFNYSYFKNPKNPVERVTWYDCIVFCNRLSVKCGAQPCYDISSIKLRDKPLDRDTYLPYSIDYAIVREIPGAKGFRLPYEREWQVASMLGLNRAYFTVNEDNLLDKAWINENSNKKTHPVAQKKPNEWGLYDINGNVEEWCWDTYIRHNVYALTWKGRSKKDFFTENRKKKPIKRVTRGGGWSTTSRLINEMQNRLPNEPGGLSYNLGFRIAMTII